MAGLGAASPRADGHGDLRLHRSAGTPLVKTDAQGNVIAKYDYTPYGNSVASLGSPPNGPGYTGHVNDPETGLVYMQARYYQLTGRFLSPDPIVPSAGNVYGFNRYAYANNNPVVNIDLNGEFPGDLNDSSCNASYNCQASNAPDLPPPPKPNTWNQITQTGSNWFHQTLHDVLVMGGLAQPESVADAILGPIRIAATFSPLALEGGEVSISTAEMGSYSGASSLSADSATTSVFWSGGEAAKAAAEGWARANGGTTLEMTAQGQATEAATKGVDWLTVGRPAWVNASSNFANSASGEVHVFQSGFLSTQSVWGTTEYPALIANKNVTRITYHGVGW